MAEISSNLEIEASFGLTTEQQLTADGVALAISEKFGINRDNVVTVQYLDANGVNKAAVIDASPQGVYLERGWRSIVMAVAADFTVMVGGQPYDLRTAACPEAYRAMFNRAQSQKAVLPDSTGQGLDFTITALTAIKPYDLLTVRDEESHPKWLLTNDFDEEPRVRWEAAAPYAGVYTDGLGNFRVGYYWTGANDAARYLRFRPGAELNL